MKRKPEHEIAHLSMQAIFAFSAVMGISMITAATFGEGVAKHPPVFRFLLFTGMLILVYPVAVRHFFERHVAKREKRKEEAAAKREALKPGDKCPPPEPVHKDDMCVQPLKLGPPGIGKSNVVKTQAILNDWRVNDELKGRAVELAIEHAEADVIRKVAEEQRAGHIEHSYKDLKAWLKRLDVDIKVGNKILNIQNVLVYKDKQHKVLTPEIQDPDSGVIVTVIEAHGQDYYKLSIKGRSLDATRDTLYHNLQFIKDFFMECLPHRMVVKGVNDGDA